MGWEDAPAHVCRGGDIRGLAFCCPPVKPCPIHMKLEEVGITPQEFVDIKQNFAKNNKLGAEVRTCYGSLVWCCKGSKPCPLRDAAIQSLDMTLDEYMTLKKELADEIVKHSNQNNLGSDNQDIKNLAETFNISYDEAKRALEESGNDLKSAIRNLKVKTL